MNSLDESNRQLSQRQAMSQAAAKHTEHLTLVYHERILPKMELIYSGLGTLCENLNQSENAIVANYFIEGLGRLDNLVQSDYQVSADSLVEINGKSVV